MCTACLATKARLGKVICNKVGQTISHYIDKTCIADWGSAWIVRKRKRLTDQSRTQIQMEENTRKIELQSSTTYFFSVLLADNSTSVTKLNIIQLVK